MDIISQLNEDDLVPYSPKHKMVVVRIFKKGRLFIGKLYDLDFSVNPELTIRLQPIVELHTNLSSTAFDDLGETLVTIKDVLVEKTYCLTSQPFLPIQKPDRVSLKNFSYDNTLAIKFADGIAVLSKRECDTEAVLQILEKATARVDQT